MVLINLPDKDETHVSGMRLCSMSLLEQVVADIIYYFCLPVNVK